MATVNTSTSGDSELPQNITKVCGGVYKRDSEGVWRYTIGTLAGAAVPGARDVTVADLTGAAGSVPRHPDHVAVCVPDAYLYLQLDRSRVEPRFAWLEQHGRKTTAVGPAAGHLAECRLVPLAVWQQVKAVVVDMTAPELTPGALLTTSQAALHAFTTVQGLRKAAERYPDIIRPVVVTDRGNLWSAPIIEAYGRIRRSPGRPAGRIVTQEPDSILFGDAMRARVALAPLSEQGGQMLLGHWQDTDRS